MEDLGVNAEYPILFSYLEFGSLHIRYPGVVQRMSVVGREARDSVGVDEEWGRMSSRRCPSVVWTLLGGHESYGL